VTETLIWRKVGSEQVWFDDVDSREAGESERRLTSLDPESWSGSLRGPIDVDEHVSPEMVEGLPIGLVHAYAERAVRHVRVQETDPGVWFASVVGLDGAWGDGGTPDEACRELHEAIVGWVAVKRRLGIMIPPIDGMDLNTAVADPKPA
jgi:predicted RNase H-like HicB family nuclease